MINRRVHGIVKPNRHNNIPARVVNINSRRNKPQNTKIRLDKLLRSEKPKICIKRRLGGIGDVIMSLPLLESIKKLIPHCHLIYATDIKYAQCALRHVVEHNPFVDEIISWSDIKDEDYDYWVDITTTGLEKEKAGTIPPNRIDMFADEVGVNIEANPVPVYIVTEKEKEDAEKELEENLLKGTERSKVKIIGVQTRSNDARRTWPIGHVRELIAKLTKLPNTKVVIFDWGKTAKEWDSSENAWAMLDRELPITAAVVDQLDLMICPDSALLHLAGALNKKILSIFGPIPPECRINYYINASSISLNLPCKNCFYTPRCIRTGSKMECLIKLTPEMVFDAAVKKLKEPMNISNYIGYGKDLSVGNQDDIILVKRTTSGMGDLLMATNGIEALKVKFPKKKIHVACKKELQDILKNNPHIDGVVDVTKPVNYKRYYMIIDISTPCTTYETARLSMGKRVEKNRVEIFAEAMGVRNLITDLLPRYYVTEQEREEAVAFFRECNVYNPAKPKVAVALSSAEEYRNWPKEHYNVLIEKLRTKLNIVTIHNKRGKFYDSVIDACALPIRRALAILSECDLLVTVDTGLMHVAAALGIPTVALFGPIDYRARCRGYKNVTVVSCDKKCIPCWRNARTKCKENGLVKGYSECMKDISPNQLIKIINDKFKSGAQQ